MTKQFTAPDPQPAFVAPVYGSMKAVPVRSDVPPLFGVFAADEPLCARKGRGSSTRGSRRGPLEFQLYQSGGRGVGLRKAGTTSAGWLRCFHPLAGCSRPARPKMTFGNA